MAALRFMLNGERRTEEHASPAMTVLDYLRNVARLTGTKEGCAEGDCGACTILVTRSNQGKTTHQAVNSCLMMLGQLDGAVVRTVEGVAGPDGALHPAQQALVDADATQCGFCTPGFVMAMVAFHESGEPVTDAAIHEALAGNLCRCTGYRPIVDACRRLPAIPAAAHPARTASIDAKAYDYRAGAQRFIAPDSLDALSATMAAHPKAWLLGGGTDLGVLVSKERQSPPVVIATARVPELKRIAMAGPALELGGAVTYSEALPEIDAAFPAFGALIRRIGSRQIRNLGTIAGNLATASPIGDTLPVLIALDAGVDLRSAAGMRSMSVEQFITGYRKIALQAGEFIQTIRIPKLSAGQRLFAYKLSKRFDQDISAVIAAFRLEVAPDGMLAALRAAYGGMASTPSRAHSLETALVGRPWSAHQFAGVDAALSADFQPIGDLRAGAAYRVAAAANLVRRLYADSTADSAAVRLEAL